MTWCSSRWVLGGCWMGAAQCGYCFQQQQHQQTVRANNEDYDSCACKHRARAHCCAMLSCVPAGGPGAGGQPGKCSWPYMPCH